MIKKVTMRRKKVRFADEIGERGKCVYGLVNFYNDGVVRR